MVCDPRKDYWRKTYYKPLLVKNDGPALLARLSVDKIVTVETAFTLVAKSQFDQAGLFLRLDDEHWLKAGIEVSERKITGVSACTRMTRTSCIGRGRQEPLILRGHKRVQ